MKCSAMFTMGVATTLGVAMAQTPGQMNTHTHYRVANPASGSENKSFGFRGEWFEVVVGPITSRYSEVYWKPLPSVPLPETVVKQFDGKVMHITGWEVDIFRNTTSGMEAVPCYESYNHHYVGHVSGKGAQVSVTTPPADAEINITHGGPSFQFTDNGLSEGLAPTNQAVSEHNGNEMRQTYVCLYVFAKSHVLLGYLLLKSLMNKRKF